MIDTQQLRKTAAMLDDTSQQLRTRIKEAYKTVSCASGEKLHGKCSEVITERSLGLAIECEDCSIDIEKISMLIREIARAFDEADDKAKTLIENR